MHPRRSKYPLSPDPAKDEVLCLCYAVRHGGIDGALHGGIVVRELEGNIRPIHAKTAHGLHVMPVGSEEEVCDIS